MEKPLCRSSKGRSCAAHVQITSETVQPSPWAILRSTARPGLPVKARCSKARSNSTAIFAKRSSRTNGTTQAYQGRLAGADRGKVQRGFCGDAHENENRKPGHLLEAHSSNSCLSRGQSD